MRDAALRLALPLNVPSLLMTAQRTAGHDVFGPPALEEPLHALVHGCERDTVLTLFGRLAMRTDIKRMLVNRLRIMADRRRQPAIAQERIQQPLFITGLPRTGTTLLHALLAQDPAHRAPLTWEIMHPSPPPFEQDGDNTPRIQQTARELRWLHRLAPRFQAIHEVGPELPQECIAITAHTFLSLRFIVTHRLPTYAEYFAQRDTRESYAFHRRFLQHLQFNAPPQRWVLKAPAHLPVLDALLAVYPDALIVQTHRDPVDSIPSLASLRSALRSCFARDVDPSVVGPEVAHYWADALERANEVRHRESTARFHDVQYDALMRDPIDTVRGLYDRFELVLTRETESRMRTYLAANPQGKHGQHDYEPERFGLVPGMLSRIFRDYRRRMGWTGNSSSER